MSKKKIKKRMIALDADKVVFMCTEGKATKASFFGKESGEVSGNYKEPLKPYKQKFKAIVKDFEDMIAANLVGEVKGIKVFLSDPETNFRYDIYPEYKGEREKRSQLFYRLRKWALKKYGYVKNLEADDIVAYYVGIKGWIGASEDKDLLRGVAGTWFNIHYMHYTLTQNPPMHARNFNMIQTITGDPVDNIKALPKKAGDPMIPIPDLEKGKRQPFKMTEKLAIAALDKHGWTYEGVLKVFEEKGFGIKELTLNRRLIGMDQWTPKKGVKLWHMPKINKHS